MYKNIIYLALVGAIVASCGHKSKKSQPEEVEEIVSESVILGDTADTSQNSLDVDGTYEGVLPCADCDGIKTRLTLVDSTGVYTLVEEYLKDGVKPIETKGKYHWSKDGGTIVLDKDGVQYKVGEGKLFRLDENGKMVKGPLEDDFILLKN